MFFCMLFHQVATAVNGATDNSLVIIDEFGKGTATVLSLNSVISNVTLSTVLRVDAGNALNDACFSCVPCLDRWPVLIDCYTASLA